MTLMALSGVLVFSALAVVVAVFLARCWFEEFYGDLAMHWLLPKAILQVGSVILLLGMVIFVGMKVLAQVDPDLLMIPAFGLGLGALWAAWGMVARDRSRAGAVLVDLGQTEARGMIAVIIFALLGLSAIVLTVVDRDLFMALQALFFVSSAFMSYLITRMHTVLTEKGIYTPNGCVTWDQVEAYRWSGGTGESHTLVLGVKRRFFRTKVLRVPWHAFDEVSDIMEEKVGSLLFEHPSQDTPQGQGQDA